MSAEKKKTTPLGKSEGEEPERFMAHPQNPVFMHIT